MEKEEKVVVDSSSSATEVEGSIPPDTELWTHLQFVRNEVQGCSSTKEQLERLGRCVSPCVGVGVGVCVCGFACGCVHMHVRNAWHNFTPVLFNT